MLTAVAALVVLVLSSGDGDHPATGLAGAAEPRGEFNGRPATDQARLTVRWPAATESHQRELAAAWRPGGRAVIEGRLNGGAGLPIANARISVLAADDSEPEQGSLTVGEVRTDRQGRFATAIAVDRGAAHKLLTFVYLASSRDRVPAATARARLVVSGTVTAWTATRRTRRGASVRLEGRCVRGATVEVWVRPPGLRRWRVSSVAHASAAGRWEAAAYVPSYGSRGTYGLRARVVGDRRRGFLSSESRPISVRVW